MPSVATSNPSTLARPEVAGNNPSRILIRVDLPAPFAPTSPTIPGCSSKLSWSRAVTALYRLVRFSIEIIMADRAYRRSPPRRVNESPDSGYLGNDFGLPLHDFGRGVRP